MTLTDHEKELIESSIDALVEELASVQSRAEIIMDLLEKYKEEHVHDVVRD